MPHTNRQTGGVVAQVLYSAKDVSPKVSLQISTEEKVRGLLDKVRSGIETRAGYARLFGLMCFFVVYVMALLLQQTVEDSFAVESR